ncbi:MAG: ATP-binding cassette domain-containing protein [Solobacterium sp.]|nr:ATP-binding cassette domain-containing protein [Solobacterium sp.]MBR2670542.1 ATP-binding cassette domain-containing protein [Solobacterium sp.]
MSNALIEVKNLKKYFKSPRGTVHAVDNVTFNIEEGKTLGLVGESGCGKSTLGRTIIHLLEPTDGQIFYRGEDVTHPDKAKLSELRHEMQIIFQDPYSSLNPRKTIKETIEEPLILSKKFTAPGALEAESTRIMDLVGIEKRLRMSYPHELDGGRRQRVGIARALALNPKLVVCDEPVSALDVSIQAQILNLLMDLQDEYKLTYLFVTHNLSVVRHISHSIVVMYLGQIVEMCQTDELFENQLHPYSKALLSAVPTVDIHNQKERIIMKGEITSPIDPKPECRFVTRCPYASSECLHEIPLREIKPGHFVACDRCEEINGL